MQPLHGAIDSWISLEYDPTNVSFARFHFQIEGCDCLLSSFFAELFMLLWCTNSSVSTHRKVHFSTESFSFCKTPWKTTTEIRSFDNGRDLPCWKDAIWAECDCFWSTLRLFDWRMKRCLWAFWRCLWTFGASLGRVVGLWWNRQVELPWHALSRFCQAKVILELGSGCRMRNLKEFQCYVSKWGKLETLSDKISYP